ncbi:hypothetical protein RZS28_06370 [Methylocapsa polymorpha]|uniref:Uncharacterized protein n=1 Tax=Methylocapsa polymorpha TaxID=3080828 RepID=A0ABZ0HVV5_9HYPH|nr:hypothetical protein RZS28_06370 [Methylocapsa sp. RX1]
MALRLNRCFERKRETIGERDELGHRPESPFSPIPAYTAFAGAETSFAAPENSFASYKKQYARNEERLSISSLEGI